MAIMVKVWAAMAVAGLLSAAGYSTAATAAECDFDKPVGSCTAQYKILSTSGSKPSFRAEISVHSSAPRCSKVEWYLDSTPHSTVLKAANSDTDSVFGTSPITAARISIQKCTVYAEKGGQGSAGSAKQGPSNKTARYGSCADNAEARRILDTYDSEPNATLAASLSNIRKNLPVLRSILTKTQGYRSDAAFYANNKAKIESEIGALQQRVDWNANAIRVLERCAG